MSKIKIFILLIIIFTTSGCWNYRELSELSIISSIGIDFKDGEYNISAGIVNAKKVSISSTGGTNSSNESPTIVYESKGKTIKEAINNLVLQVPYEPYVGHLNLLVLSEDVTKKGIYNILDYFIADTEIRKIFPVIVIKNAKAVDVIKIITPLETLTSINTKQSLMATAKINGVVSNRQFDEILMCLYMNGRHPTITAAEIIGEDPKEGETIDSLSHSKAKADIKITGSAVLIKDKLVGYLDEEESLGYTILRDMAKTINITFKCDDEGNYSTVVINKIKTELKVKPVKDKPYATINITGNASIPEYNCKAISKDPIKSIKLIEKKINKELNKTIDKTMIKLQEDLKSDVIGFGERLFKDHYSFWKKNKKEWDETFSTTKYKLNTNIKVVSVDSTNKPAKEE